MAPSKVLILIPVFNEGKKILRTLGRLERAMKAGNGFEGFEIAVLLVDDGSRDDALQRSQSRLPFMTVHRHPVNLGQKGILRTLRASLRGSENQFVLTLAGNDKDDPQEIPRLLIPLREGRADVVQGSRYVGGCRGRNMPLHRALATRLLHPWLTYLATGKSMTDTTNGFRAYRREVLLDSRIDLERDWLERYSYEPFLLLRSIQLGYRVLEVPVTKAYPPGKGEYTKMRPLVDWWGILKPVVRMALGRE